MDAQSKEIEQWRELFVQAPVGFAILDDQSRVVRMNTALAGITGLQPDNCNGKHLRCLGNVIGPSLERLSKRISEGGCEIHNEEVVEHNSSGTRNWLVSVYPIRLQNAWEIGVIVREVTEIRKLQERMRRAEQMGALGRMAAGTAHDFNNLLMGVIGNLGLLSNSLPEDDQHRILLDSALVSAQKAADLTAKILAFTGRSPLSVAEVNLRDVIASAVDSADCPSNIRLHLDVRPDLPRIEGDADKLQILFESLLVNAYEAIGTKTGVVNISARTERREGGDFVAIDVQDDGCGVETRDLTKIFEPFYTSKFLGRGLGLSQALGIARSHGGTITVSSEIGQGSLFEVVLPVSMNERSSR